jgi:hypothetical protein
MLAVIIKSYFSEEISSNVLKEGRTFMSYLRTDIEV